jgi:hypothetical protein
MTVSVVPIFLQIPLPAVLALPASLWDNTLMIRWLTFLLAIAIGAAAGLYYGWVINPIRYIDAAPDSLRSDYKADYVLMTPRYRRMATWSWPWSACPCWVELPRPKA